MEDPCMQGKWEDGVCVCNQGYDVGFDELTLNPKYCANETVTIIELTTYLSTEQLSHFISMAVTVVIATWSLLGLFSVFIAISELYQLHKAIQKVQMKWHTFKVEQNKYDEHELMSASLWDPPTKQFKCITS